MFTLTLAVVPGLQNLWNSRPLSLSKTGYVLKVNRPEVLLVRLETTQLTLCFKRHMTFKRRRRFQSIAWRRRCRERRLRAFYRRRKGITIFGEYGVLRLRLLYL